VVDALPLKASRHPRWEPVIGLEVHVQLSTRSKMFCRCQNRFGAPPNSLTCPVCLGHPGTLPFINQAALESAIRAGLASSSRIAGFTKFDRKNYYYPDLPKNYQISQYDLPICSEGAIEFFVDGQRRRVGLVRIHLEEDAGKNIHAAGARESRVDLNRAGVPLLEIVSQPDIRSPEEAGAYLKMLRLIMVHLGISQCNMEEGSLRCDANVSIRPRGSERLETRTEIKNVNSFSFIMIALEHEIARQIGVREAGGTVVQETRLYDSVRDETRSMRGKEEAHDYRYFPEPDLAPIEIDEGWLARLRSTIPTLPIDWMERMMKEHGLPFYDAEVLVQDPAVAGYFEECLRLGPGARAAAGGAKAAALWAKAVSNWIVNEVFGLLNERKASIRDLGLPPARLAELVEAVERGEVSKQGGRDLLPRLLGAARPLAELVAEMGIAQISDDAYIRREAEAVLAEHGAVVEELKKGKKNALNFLVGQVMRRTKGKANPAAVSEVIRKITG
jgi:aspartyl-tRNA(Asn)/glutamyl-tRNA(Gln) amidotransferase subunit B